MKVKTSQPVGVSRDRLRRTHERQQREAQAETRQAASSPGDKNLIPIRKPAARLQGGPRDGWVYYIDDLEAQKRSAEGQNRQFEYVPTGAHTTLPWTGGVKGVIWRHRSLIS